METRIVSEKKYKGNINDLLIIYGFDDDFMIGSDIYTKFYVKAVI